MQHRVSHSLIVKPLPLLVQTSPVFVRVSDQTFSSPPSVPKRSLRCPQCSVPCLAATSDTGSHCVRIDGFTSYDANCNRLRRRSPIQPAVRSPRQSTVALFVCLSEPYRSNFVVPTRFRDLCALIENRVRSAGANIGHCPSQRKHPNVWYAVLAVRSSARTAPCRQQY
jgi:hypothetical protein